ncbi:hypothetical protein OS493_035842 [Desmophyllum pertusum]|uniref:Uncharacterized protein n=1 Tax=Desmophyllum pertusum TaxID=174260 RepID=A0A9W9ZVM7_9CNID|nr:hypothetical protein OS493_035842 [Desmophyllum pertusum]
MLSTVLCGPRMFKGLLPPLQETTPSGYGMYQPLHMPNRPSGLMMERSSLVTGPSMMQGWIYVTQHLQSSVLKVISTLLDESSARPITALY